MIGSVSTPLPGADDDLRGIIAASLTPIRPDGTIDVDRMTEHMRWLFRAGCTFVSPFGSTGEGASFSVREKSAALRAFADAGIAPARLIPASMSAALDDVAETVRTAAALGCRAVLIAPPFYYSGASQEGIAAFFDALAGRLGGDLPIELVLYHIPALTRIPFSVSLITRLIDRYGTQIVGIKDSTGDRDHTLMLQRTFPELRVFTGDDRVLPDLVDAGGAGMIGGMPNVVADDLCAIFRDGPAARGSARYAHAGQRIEAVDALGGISALKALKARISGDRAWARPLPPLEALDAGATEALVGAFARTEFLFPPEP